MTQREDKRGPERILELLREMPHPGKVLLDYSKDGISGLKLRPKSIPENLALFNIELKILKGENEIQTNGVRIDSYSQEWRNWLENQEEFTIQLQDLGGTTEQLLERKRNFNRGIIHSFLDSLTVTMRPSAESISILDLESYPHYFWENATSVSGCSTTTGHAQSIRMRLEVSSPAISEKHIYVEYNDVVPESGRVYLESIIKWHRMLISLLHSMKKCKIEELPIDYVALERQCQAEIRESQVRSQ